MYTKRNLSNRLVAAAVYSCTHCHGVGVDDDEQVCRCVLIGIARQARERAALPVSRIPMPVYRRGSWSWPAIEYRAEVAIAQRRADPDGLAEFSGIRGDQYYCKYQALRRIGAEVLARGLYPPDEYHYIAK